MNPFKPHFIYLSKGSNAGMGQNGFSNRLHRKRKFVETSKLPERRTNQLLKNGLEAKHKVSISKLRHQHETYYIQKA